MHVFRLRYYDTLGAAFGFWPEPNSAEFGLFEIDQFTFGLFYFLGLKFISKRILGHNILQLTYIFSILMTLQLRKKDDSPERGTYIDDTSQLASYYFICLLIYLLF
jgi:hypothetical protein